MTCEMCDAADGAVYTLSAQIADTDMVVDMSFCSTVCLREWLGEESAGDASAGPSASTATPSWIGQGAKD